MSVLNLPWVDLNDGTGLGVATGTDTIRASNRTRDYAPQSYGWQINGLANAQQIHDAQVIKIGFTGKTATSVTYVNPNTKKSDYTESYRDYCLCRSAKQSQGKDNCNHPFTRRRVLMIL